MARGNSRVQRCCAAKLAAEAWQLQSVVGGGGSGNAAVVAAALKENEQHAGFKDGCTRNAAAAHL